MLPALPSTLQSFQPGRAALLWGEPVRLMAARIAAWAVVRGERVVVLDGVNVFDPYRLVREALARGVAARMALSRVQVARAFTCHQLARLAEEHLAGALTPDSFVLVLGPVSLFYDEQVPLAERRRLFKRLIGALSRAKAKAPLLLLQPPRPSGAPNRRFGQQLRELVEVVGEFGEGPGDQRSPAIPHTPLQPPLTALGRRHLRSRLPREETHHP